VKKVYIWLNTRLSVLVESRSIHWREGDRRRRRRRRWKRWKRHEINIFDYIG
jgi:hypothetical protein